MATVVHKTLKLAENHSANSFSFADSIARLAAILTSDDVGKIALQLSDNTFWLLASVSPVKWIGVDGTNTGDITVGTVGAANANGLSLSGQVLSATPADATHPGLVTTGSQTFGGQKTFSQGQIVVGSTGNGTTFTKTLAATFVANQTLALQGNINDGASAVGATIDNAVTLSTAGAKLLSVRNNGTEKAFIDKDGGISTQNNVNMTGANGAINIMGSNGGLFLNGNKSAGDAGVDVNISSSVIRTAGKLLSVQNNGAEKASIDFAGNLVVSGSVTGSGFSVSGTNTGDVSLTTVGSSPSSSGASLAGQVLTLQPADATHPGLVTSGTQTIGGAKTFSTKIIVGEIDGPASTGVLAQSNVIAAGSGPDFTVDTTNVRTNGLLLAVNNQGVTKLQVDTSGNTTATNFAVATGPVSLSTSPLKAVAALYNSVSPQSLPTGSTVVNFNSTTLDTDSAVSNPSTNWTFTCPAGKGGLYDVKSTIVVSGSGSGVAFIYVTKNATETNRGTQVPAPGSSTNFTLQVSCMVPMFPGDTLQILAAQTTSNTWSVSFGSSIVYVSVVRVPGS
jgi:hypothetical protein